MPYTEAQRRLFCARAKDDPEMAKLCKEASSMPTRKAPPKKKDKKG